MAQFSVLLLTAAPPGISSETGGAFVKVDGRESVLRCAELFLNRDNVKQIQVVVLPGMMEEAKRKYGGHLSLFGVKLISAGPGWIDQIAGAAEKIAPTVSSNSCARRSYVWSRSARFRILEPMLRA